MRSKPIAQIHDSILFDTCPDELNDLVCLVKKIGSFDIRQENKWIIVPLEIKFEATEVDESWYMKKPFNGGIQTL